MNILDIGKNAATPKMRGLLDEKIIHAGYWPGFVIVRIKVNQ